jgi:hypothetical protein
MWAGRKDDGRYLRLSYEELTQEPVKALSEVRDLVNQSAPVPSVTGSQVPLLRTTHELSGNPSRFTSGMIDIRMDEEWSEKMGFRDRLLVSSITAPLLFYYGYTADSARFSPRLRETES